MRTHRFASILTVLAVFVISTAGAAEEPSSFSLLDARAKGVFNIGPGQGNVKRVPDKNLGHDVLQFDYDIPGTSIIGVWTQGFPEGLGPEAVDTIRFDVHIPSPEQLQQVGLKLEIKGTRTVQTIPLFLETGWNTVRESVQWERIGNLKEVVLVVSPVGATEGEEPVSGSVSFTAEFHKQAAPAPSAVTPEGEVSPLLGLLDSRAKGVFNIGPGGQGDVKRVSNDVLGRDVLQFDYKVPLGSIIGVWTQGFPPEINSETVDAIRLDVNVPTPEQLQNVALKVEIKGPDAMQTIPLTTETGWNTVREPINWNRIGTLKEVVLVVSPVGTRTDGEDTVAGTVSLTANFYQLTFWQKNLTFLKVGLVLLISLFTAWLIALFGRKRTSGVRGTPSQPTSETSTRPRPTQDLLYGMLAVLMAAIALSIYAMGTMSVLDAGVGVGFLAIGFAGAAIAELWKFSITGKHLTPAEVFQNMLLTGLLAAGSSRQELWQAPSTWAELLTITNLSAVLAFLIYHIANACALASSGRHLRPATGAMIVGTPYLLGLLLVLQNTNLLQTLAGGLTGGLLAAWPGVLELAGRFLAVFVFNELVTNGISLVTGGRLVKAGKAHLVTAFVSLAVILSPLIANVGSTASVAALPIILQAIVAVVTTMLAHAGLWGEVHLITGMILDSLDRHGPSSESITNHVRRGMCRGMAFSGLFMTILYALSMLLNIPGSQALMASVPILIGILAGSLIFPFLKAIIETFDGSLPFFDRVRYSYRQTALYARGAVAGFGFSYALTQDFFQQGMADRMLFGLLVGFMASGGVSLVRDTVYAFKGQGKIQSWRLYFIDALLGGFIGSAAAFYMDALQVPVVVEKFRLYTTAGFEAVDYITYPLVSKWGRIDLGSYTGGVRLLYSEAVAGVINWSIAAWLFAINRVFMEAYFKKDKSPIKFFFSKAGLIELIRHMLFVLRWGLWMSPIIFTFLRMMPDPTWYNQDGAIRTLSSVYHNMTMSPGDFRQWSLDVFVYVLAVDAFRVLIWMDHMGLRVATLVNLSFIGLDKLDERIARFIGPAAAQRYIPEAVKRFCTWCPLLIPFYLPRGKDWDYAWSTAEAMQSPTGAGGLVAAIRSMEAPQLLLLMGVTVLVCTGISFGVRLLRRRSRRRREKAYKVGNRVYTVVLKEGGEGYSQVVHKGFDVTRRSYDTIDPCGRILYLVDTAQGSQNGARIWPVVGNFPKERFTASQISRNEDVLKVMNAANGVKTTIDVQLPDQDSTVELWTVTLENLTDTPRQLKVVPYLEWVLGKSLDDRFHTQYARLFSEMEYVSGANAVLAWQKSTKSMGILASDAVPEGFLTSRVDFIGRAQSIWAPRVLETLRFLEARDTVAYPTFDPIGSLLVDVSLTPRSSRTLRFMVGFTNKKETALELIRAHLKPQAARAASDGHGPKKSPPIGHGEILPGTPQPCAEYRDHGNTLVVRTPYTPRPFDHGMSNEMGHSVMVTNRGLHTSCSANSQQNRLTPDWPDTVTREVPSEAIYLYDPQRKEWFSPTYHPLNSASAKYETAFSVDGTAVFRMTQGTLATELTVFVPPKDPTGVYLLTIKNNDSKARRLRVAPYFQMVLAFQPEQSGPLGGRYDQKLNALFFENPRNTFRTGPAFVAMTLPAERVETKRGRFLGTGRGAARPYLVENGSPDTTQLTDESTIAALLGIVEVPAHGEQTIAIILGQTDTREEALAVLRKYHCVEAARESLEQTRAWWLNLMGTTKVETDTPEFDQLQNWLKYQALAERVWARRGFYQTSGAYGFRDQLQDTVNLMWVDPALARRQIILHASQQFLEGDVFHWFFTLTDGRTAFACRSHASDNPLWLAWGVVEYLRATGDESVLDEMTSYVVSENPFEPLPKNKVGWGGLYHRSTKADSVYGHCMKSINLVLDTRMGRRGLPLIGTGDWNDGLDEIGSEGRGESVWLGFFLYYILKDMVEVIERKEGCERKEHYLKKMQVLKAALELTWRTDRYLRAIHDDGTEIGMKGSGVWEIDALTAAWAVMSGVNFKRGLTVFDTALRVLEREKVVLLGWPALREDTTPHLGRSSKYPEGVRENGMYCHGVQWLIKAARILAEEFERQGDTAKASEYRETTYRLWRKITPVAHVTEQECENYGGQPNKQPADILTTFDQGRMIWNGYTGAAGWLFRQSIEGVVGASLVGNKLVLPEDLDKPRGTLTVRRVHRDLGKSPLKSSYPQLVPGTVCG